MTFPDQSVLKRTALNAVHKAAGAKMVGFGGWEMPIEYSGIVQEHMAVRQQAGLFDVSHMGEVEIRGPQALTLLQHLTSNDVSRLQIWQAQYTALMHPRGGAVDDCLVYRLGQDRYFVCVNAANTDKDFAWIVGQNIFGADVRNVSTEYSQLALQGPQAAEIMAKVTNADLKALRYYWCCPATCVGVKGLLSRTGYTGEDGFEFYFPPNESERVWQALLEAGRPQGLVPVGLGARNTLRLEAAYPLYGHELTEETTLFEAGLGWIVKLDKGNFLGSDLLRRQKQEGLRKKLIGFEVTGQGVARDGYPVRIGNEVVGQVTSGSHAPYLKKSVGLGYVPSASAEAGQEIEIEIRSRRVPARVVPLPFYKRAKS